MTRSDPNLTEPNVVRLRRAQWQLENKATTQPEAPAVELSEPATKAAVEVDGPEGPDPTRFGDWERNGRCIDF